MYGNYFNYSYQDVFKLVDQLEVWSDILSVSAEIGRYVTSPFRPDNNPKCFLRDYNGLILFTDFAFPEYNKFTCVHAVAKLKQVNLQTAANLICNKYLHKADIKFYGLPTIQTNEKTTINKSSSSIHFEPFRDSTGQACYSNIDKEYWIKRNVSSSQLQKHDVYSVHHFFINQQYIKPKLPSFAYLFNNGNVKIYSPYDLKHKWVSTCTSEDIWKSIDFPPSEFCIITKSLKDLMVLENLIDCDIYAFQNEGVIPDLNFLSVYASVLVLYDNDLPGYKAAKTLVQAIKNFGFTAKAIFIPEELKSKDIDELYINEGEWITSEVIYELIYQNTHNYVL